MVHDVTMFWTDDRVVHRVIKCPSVVPQGLQDHDVCPTQSWQENFTTRRCFHSEERYDVQSGLEGKIILKLVIGGPTLTETKAWPWPQPRTGGRPIWTTSMPMGASTISSLALQNIEYRDIEIKLGNETSLSRGLSCAV